MLYNYLKESGPVFAFNIWSMESAKAVMDAAVKQKKNVILQVSAGIYRQTDYRQMKSYVKSFGAQCGIDIWLHLDHCRDVEMINSAIECGWDSVMIDASAESINKNIEMTNQVVGLAHKKNVLVEAEVGQVTGVEDEISVSGARVAEKEQVALFIKETNVDMIAVAFGNAHGLYHGSPRLNYDLVRYTTGLTDIPFVVHGGSGLSDEVLRELLGIEGVKKINISTEVKLAYRSGIVRAQETGALDVNGFQPVKVERIIHDAIMDMAVHKMKLLD